MRIRDAVPVITGAAAGIGRAVAFELARREVHGLALVDHRESVAEVARAINERAEDWVCFSFRGDVTDVEFRRTVYRETIQRCGTVNICVPASACRRGESLHRQVETEVISPVSWALEMVADIGRSQTPQTCTRWPPGKPLQGIVVFIDPGTLLHHGPRIICPAAKAKLRRATKALTTEANHRGVGCAVMLSTDTLTPTVRRATGGLIETAFPSFQIPHSMPPEGIAKAICRIISNACASREFGPL